MRYKNLGILEHFSYHEKVRLENELQKVRLENKVQKVRLENEVLLVFRNRVITKRQVRLDKVRFKSNQG